MNKICYNNLAAFCEALAIHAEALQNVVEYYRQTPELIIIESVQEYLEADACNRALFVQYMGEIAAHAIIAAGREGYPLEVWS